MKKGEIVYLIVISIIFGMIAIRGAVIAFSNPELTQTQVFKRVFLIR